MSIRSYVTGPRGYWLGRPMEVTGGILGRPEHPSVSLHGGQLEALACASRLQSRQDAGVSIDNRAYQVPKLQLAHHCSQKLGLGTVSRTRVT